MPHFSINRKHHHVSYNSKQSYQTPRNVVVGNVEPEKPSNEQMKIMLEDLQAEFDAYRESSAELEQELEKELERVEARARQAENVLQGREEEHRQTTVDLTRQLMSCQGELEELRRRRRESVETVRSREEALEQTEEKERRARAEVDTLREALDATMELATLSQTELEEFKRTSETTTRHLFEDLEEAHSELALLTPIKGLLTPMTVAASSLGGDLGSRPSEGRGGDGSSNGNDVSNVGDEAEDNGAAADAGANGTKRRHFFTMTSNEHSPESSDTDSFENAADAGVSGSEGSNVSPGLGRFLGGSPTDEVMQGEPLSSPRLLLSKLGLSISNNCQLENQQSPTVTLDTPRFLEDEASHLQDAIDEGRHADAGHFVGAPPPPPECAGSESSISSFSAASSASVSPVNGNMLRVSGEVARREMMAAASPPKAVSPTEVPNRGSTSPIARRDYTEDEAVDGCKRSCKKAIKRGMSRQDLEEKGCMRRKGSAAAMHPSSSSTSSLDLLCCGMDSEDEDNNLGSLRAVLGKWRPFGWGAPSRKRS